MIRLLAVGALALLAAAPGASRTPAPQIFTIGFGMTARSGSLGFTPRRIEEDSRCPASVRCIQAGTVRLSLAMTGFDSPRTTMLTLGVPRQVRADKWLTLSQVCPYPAAPGAIARAGYRFTIAVSRDAPGPIPARRCA
jgi:hypothetical protein